MDSSMLLWMLLVPAIAGLICFVWPRRGAWVVHLVTIAAAVWLLVAAARLMGNTGVAWQWQWMDVGPLSLSLDLLATKFGSVIVLLTAVFGVLISLYCVKYTTQHVGKHNAYVLWALAGAIAGGLANNLILLLIGWEVVTLMLFVMVNLGGEKAKAGAAKSFAILGFSDCAMLLGILLLVLGVSGATLNMQQLQVQVDSPLTVICFLLFLATALAKAGAMPLHTWIPAAAEGAPADVMAFLPAALDKLLGIYLLARVSLQFFVLGENIKLIVMAIGAVTIIGTVMMAMIQHDLKKLLSFHAISQVGYMVLGVGTGSIIGVAGGVFHMINHAMYKSCLFLTAGSIEKQAGTTELDKLGGLARAMPVSFFACVVASLAISGVPPMNGFASKWMIYQAALEVPSRVAPILVAAAVFGSALTLASFVKVIHSVFLGSRPQAIAEKPPKESSIWMTAPMVVLAVACIVFGVFASLPLQHLVAPAMTTLKMEGLSEYLHAGNVTGIETLWNPVLATGLLLLALVVGVVIFALGRGFRIRRTRVYIGAEKLSADSAHYSGTGFYDTVRRLPGIRAVYGDAEREAFDVYHICQRLGGSLVAVLRRCQTGVLPLYVSWVVLGLVVIVLYLFGAAAG